MRKLIAALALVAACILAGSAHAGDYTSMSRVSLSFGGGLQWFEARNNDKLVHEFRYRREPVISVNPKYQLGQSSAIVGRLAMGLDSRLATSSVELQFTWHGR